MKECVDIVLFGSKKKFGITEMRTLYKSQVQRLIGNPGNSFL